MSDIEQRIQDINTFIDGMTFIHDYCDGYKIALINRGYSKEAAEQMTVDFHRLLMVNQEIR